MRTSRTCRSPAAAASTSTSSYPAEQVDPILYNKAYYLEPDGVATKPYVLLRDALLESDRVAIVKVALRQREQLATLRVRDGVLVLNTMLWPDEIRAASFDFLDEDVAPPAPGAGDGVLAHSSRWQPTSSPRSTPTTTGRRCSR